MTDYAKPENEVYVLLSVKPDCLEDFVRITSRNVRASRTEPGNLKFDLYQSLKDRTSFVLHEVYRSDKAAQAHKETSHYARWVKEVLHCMASPRSKQGDAPSDMDTAYRKLL
ncbi:MAG: putative quinol monooxygenase [Candidatus Zixiibacteriota bacterium]